MDCSHEAKSGRSTGKPPSASSMWNLVRIRVLGLGLGVGVRVGIGVGARVRVRVRVRAGDCF